MKRTILISIAAGVAIVPALLGVAAASAASRGDDVRPATPTASSTVDDRGHSGADDASTATASPTSSASVDDPRDNGSDDATAASSSASAEDHQGRSSDDPMATSSATTEDRHSRGSDDDATSSPTQAATSATSTVTVDDHGHGTEAGDDSRDHGGKN
jgi:hypothetical protein